MRIGTEALRTYKCLSQIPLEGEQTSWAGRVLAGSPARPPRFHSLVAGKAEGERTHILADRLLPPVTTSARIRVFWSSGDEPRGHALRGRDTPQRLQRPECTFLGKDIC